MRGLSTGAKHTNQPWGWYACGRLVASPGARASPPARSRSCPPPRCPAAAPASPVPPARPRPPCPPSRAAIVGGFSRRSTGGLSSTGAPLQRLDEVRLHEPAAVGRRPRPAGPSASAVTVTPPWPIDTETVSPGYHWTFWIRSFHSGLGMSPRASWGRSMPVGAPRPSASRTSRCARSRAARRPCRSRRCTTGRAPGSG